MHLSHRKFLASMKHKYLTWEGMYVCNNAHISMITFML